MNNTHNNAPSWLIICHGETLSNNRLAKLAHNRRIILCDGAANQSYPFPAHACLGDFDSINPETQAELRERSDLIWIDESKNQDQTDSEKALKYALSHGAQDIIFAQAIGTRTDHSLTNINLLARYAHLTQSLVLAREQEVLFTAQQSQIHVEGTMGARVAIHGMPEASVSSQGLKYNLLNQPIGLEHINSGSNQLESESAIITVHSGRALIALQENLNHRIDQNNH